jgi:hypothetical protein
MYYSIIYNKKIIDIVQKPTFVKVLPSGHIAFTDKASANGVVGSNAKTIYAFEPVARKNTKVVTINEISESEFNRLKNLLNSNQEITADKVALEEAIQETISNLSELCHNKIINGFSVRLSDGEKHNFRLTTEDQLNLLTLESQLNSGVQTFVYHATGEPCRVFSRNEICKIINAFKQHILYHTTYFNVAKQYVASLVNIDEVKAFTYGINVARATNDDTIKQILANGGSL